MSLIKKIDVEKHFVAKRAMRLGRMPSLGQPGPAPVKPVAPAKKTPAFVADFSEEHSSQRVFAASTPVTSFLGGNGLLRPPRSLQE